MGVQHSPRELATGWGSRSRKLFSEALLKPLQSSQAPWQPWLSHGLEPPCHIEFRQGFDDGVQPPRQDRLQGE